MFKFCLCLVWTQQDNIVFRWNGLRPLNNSINLCEFFYEIITALHLSLAVSPQKLAFILEIFSFIFLMISLVMFSNTWSKTAWDIKWIAFLYITCLLRSKALASFFWNTCVLSPRCFSVPRWLSGPQWPPLSPRSTVRCLDIVYTLGTSRNILGADLVLLSVWDKVDNLCL